jgi:hypothetical protein
MDWQSVFAVDKKTLGAKGANPYFNLTSGYTLAYRNGKVAGHAGAWLSGVKGAKFGKPSERPRRAWAACVDTGGAAF